MNPLGTLLLIGALVWGVTGAIHVAHGEAAPGNVTEPAPEWKLRVTIETDAGAPVGMLVMVDPVTHDTRTWPSKEACVDFQTTDEFKNSLPGLAQHLIADGNDPNHTTVTFNCVPDVKAGSI